MFIVTCCVALMFNAGANKTTPPNFVILFADDLGYGDLGCYGHPTIRTSNLDRMATQGMRFTQFYSAACVCTPSRAALLTGRLPVRSGMCSNVRRVLFPDSTGGLPDSEITIAEVLKDVGYKTACIGKWHLGHLPQYLPTKQGFDSYFGLPYSNDMDRNREAGIFNVPLMRDEQIIERPAVQETLTRRYTEEAIRFIKSRGDQPFLLYLPYTFPHIPLFASEEFRNKSPRGLYGDVVEEMDWSVGQILDTLQSEKIAENTLVFFTSDNGPWLTHKLEGGSAGLLREGKGCTFEGGMREPAIAWWPGSIKPAVSLDLACTMDLLPTLAALAGAKIPSDRELDGLDISPVLLGTGNSPRDRMFYYRGPRLMALRVGPWKAHFYTQPAYGRNPKLTAHDPPLLFHLEHDPGEQYDVAAEHPDIIEKIRAIAKEHTEHLIPGADQLAGRMPQP